MDPISVAASVAGLVTLAGSLLKVAYQYSSEVRQATNAAQDFVDELQALQDILQRVQLLTNHTSNPPSFKDTSQLILKSKTLHAKLTSLHGKLERPSSNSMLRRLSWPLSRKECTDAITQIRAFSQLIHFSLSVDAYDLLSGISDNMIETLKQQKKNVELFDLLESRTTPLERDVAEQSWILDGAHQQRQQVLNWLADGGQERYHDRIKRDRVPGTGSWLLNHPDFTTWKTGESQNTLWCPGEMGSGKTKLASLVIDHLRESSVANELAFFYFNYAETTTQSTAQTTGSLLRQLLETSEEALPESIVELYEKHGQSSRPPLDDLQSVLHEVVNSRTKVYLVFDAIDECDAVENRKPFLGLLRTLKDCPTVLMFTTSRPYLEDIRTTLSDGLQITIQASVDDLRMFIRSRIQVADCPELEDEKFESEISDKLIHSANGLFLLPALQLKSILQEPTRGDIEDALHRLPRSLTEILDGNLHRISRQPPSRKTLAYNALMWVSLARCPLLESELCDILSVDSSRSRSLNERYRPSPRVIVECCQGLIYVDDVTQTYQLVHLAIKEHLMKRGVHFFGGYSVPKAVAVTALAYLLDPIFENGPSIADKKLDKGQRQEITTKDIKHFLSEHRFFHYLSHHWGWHVKDFQTDPDLKTMLIDFLSSRPRTSRLTQVFMYTNYMIFRYWDGLECQSRTGIHLSSRGGLVEILSHLINTGKIKVDHASKMGTTALMEAASENESDVIRELLRKGADPYKTNWYGNSLHAAAEANCPQATREFLDYGMNPNTLSPTGRTPLSCTIDRESVEVAEILLDHGALVEYPRGHRSYGKSFIAEATFKRRAKMIAMLANRGYVPSETHGALSASTGTHSKSTGSSKSIRQMILKWSGARR